MKTLVAALAGLAALVVGGPADAQQVVRFLHNETDPPSIEFFNKAIKAFEAENPGIKVEMEAVSTDGRLQKVTASMNARTMPEVFKILPEERFNFGRRGFLVPLDDVAKDIGLSDFPEEMIIRIEGKIYDLPYTLGNFSTLWYREDLLKARGVAVPKTWDEYKAAARALTQGDTYGTVFPAGKNRMTSLFFSSIFWSAGGTYFDKSLEVAFDKGDAAVKALTFLKELARYAPPGIASYSYGDMINTYLTGKIALDIYAPRLIANAASNVPDLIGKTRAAPPPAGPSGVGVRFVNQNSFAIASERVGAKNTEAAKKFLKYIITGDRAAQFSLTAYPHLIPPLKSVRSHPLVQQGTLALKDRPDFAKMAYDTSNSLDFENEAGAQIVNGKVVAGVPNPYMGSIVARDIPALVVQRVVLQGQDPAEAVKWGAAEMRRIVNDLRKRQ